MDTSSQNWYPLVLLQLRFINTIILGRFILDFNWKSPTNKNMLYLKSKIIEMGDNHMKAAEFKGLSWLKQCIGHMRTWKTLPSFAHLDGTDMWKFGSWPMDYWPPNSKEWWLAKKLCPVFSSMFLSAGLHIMRIVLLQSGVDNTWIQVNSMQSEWHSERWRPLHMGSRIINRKIFIALSHKATSEYKWCMNQDEKHTHTNWNIT